MSKLLLVIFALFAISMASSLRTEVGDNELRATNNGQISLTYIRGAGFCVPVDLSKNAIRSQYMVVATYSSSTLLSSRCFQFNPYVCGAQVKECKVLPKTFDVSFPNFIAKGNLMTTTTTLDYTYWQLGKNVPTLYANVCNSPFQGLGAGVEGIIGLGIDGTAAGNFKNTQSFSIFFNQAFRLVFNPTNQPPATFKLNLVAKIPTDGDWKIQNVQAVAFRDLRNPNNPTRNTLTGVSAIFDINSLEIGIPKDIFFNVINEFGKQGIVCQQGVIYKPVCNYNGFLPNFEIQANQNIIITPQMYAAGANGRSFQLNFKATSPLFNGNNYVTQDYEHTIILGNPVFMGYYTHFNIQEKHVQLYTVA